MFIHCKVLPMFREKKKKNKGKAKAKSGKAQKQEQVAEKRKGKDGEHDLLADIAMSVLETEQDADDDDVDDSRFVKRWCSSADYSFLVV